MYSTDKGMNCSLHTFSIPHRIKTTWSGWSTQGVLTEDILWAQYCDKPFRREDAALSVLGTHHEG